MTLHLSPETADALAALAHTRGMSVEEYLDALVRGIQPEATGPAPLSPEQWVKELQDWAASHSGLPVLSEADMSRETIYGDRGF